MANRIRVTETRVVEYEPDLAADSFYTVNNITTIEDALAADKKDYDNGDITILELGISSSVSTVWEIIDDRV